MTTQRVTAEDLDWAATWLEAYEDLDGVPAERTAQRVSAHLRAEAERRRDAATVRKIVKRTGVSPARARAFIARYREG